MRGSRQRVGLAAALPVLAGRAVRAQEKVTLRSDLLLYGDNTEFRNPFREGETIFGAAARMFVDFELNPKIAISLGAFGNQRFGSAKAFDLARPVIAVTVRGARSSFVFGTLPAMGMAAPVGPDRGGPHGLLPPLQRETLAFERPYEAGLQWDFKGRTLTHSAWLDGSDQHAGARERVDGGLKAEAPSAADSRAAAGHVSRKGALFSTVRWPTAPPRRHSVRARGPQVCLARDGRGRRWAGRFVRIARRPQRSHGRAVFSERRRARRMAAQRFAWRAAISSRRRGDPNYVERRQRKPVRLTRDYAERD